MNEVNCRYETLKTSSIDYKHMYKGKSKLVDFLNCCKQKQGEIVSLK